ncbi:ABC transporter permease [Micrococcales bacterium 31B]|nr:ABC transporter permease [Micrococcales bacterium 31B]
MTKLILKRLLAGVIILFVVSLIVFWATQALPGDAAQAILGKEATPERLAALRQQLNLNDPVVVQYLHWLGGLLTFDLGTSFANGQSVANFLFPRIMNSLVLMLVSAVIATPLSMFIGTYVAVRFGKPVDNATGMITLALASLPEFVVGIFLVFLFSTGVFHLLPAVFVANQPGPIWQDPTQLILPVVALVLAVSPYIIRMQRATSLEVLDSEYIQQARLKGIPEWKVLTRHSIPNSIGPVAQVVALQLAWLAGGVVIIEYLFRFPGIGFALVDAVANRDIPVVQGLTLLIAAVYIIVNIGADLIGLAANPKVRMAAQ